jgi:hypothetical protein
MSTIERSNRLLRQKVNKFAENIRPKGQIFTEIDKTAAERSRAAELQQKKLLKSHGLRPTGVDGRSRCRLLL